MRVRIEVTHRLEIGFEADRDIGVIQHLAKHLAIALGGHELVGVGEITVVVVGARRNTSSNPGGQLREIQSPLLAGVAAEEFLSQIVAHAVEYDVLAGLDRVAVLPYAVEITFRALLVEVEFVQLVQRGAIDGDGVCLLYTSPSPRDS